MSDNQPIHTRRMLTNPVSNLPFQASPFPEIVIHYIYLVSHKFTHVSYGGVAQRELGAKT